MNGVAEAKRHGWAMQEPGWWTHCRLDAGVTRESDGYWWVWIGGPDGDQKAGRRRTMLGAMLYAEGIAPERGRDG